MKAPLLRDPGLHAIAFILAFIVGMILLLWWPLRGYAQTFTTTVGSLTLGRPTLQSATITALQDGKPIPGTTITPSASFYPTTVTFTPSSAATINGILVSVTASGKNWTAAIPITISVTPAPVPAGGSASFTYDDPFGKAFGLSISTAAIAAASLAGSDATITAVVVAGAPPPPPVPVPAPAPPPISVASPLGSCVGTIDLARWPSCKIPAAQLAETSGAVWKLSGSTVTRNGVDTKNLFTNAGQTLSLEMAAPSTKSPGGVIHVNTLDHGFNCWDVATSRWAGSGC